MRAKNPWHNPESGFSRPFFEYDGNPKFSYRGVAVYNAYSSFDYVIDGCTICQRAGFHKDSAPQIIDGILDGKNPVAEGVANKLRSLGFNPMSYEQYTNLWQQGKVA